MKTLAEFVAEYTEITPLADPEELVRAYERYRALQEAANG